MNTYGVCPHEFTVQDLSIHNSNLIYTIVLPSPRGPWRYLTVGAVKVAHPWPAGGGAAPSAPAPAQRQGRGRANGERRGWAIKRGDGLVLPSPGGPWRYLCVGAVKVARPWPAGRGAAPSAPAPADTASLAGRHTDGERHVWGCRVAFRLPTPSTGVPWRCLGGGAMEVASPWSAVTQSTPGREAQAYIGIASV